MTGGLDSLGLYKEEENDCTNDGGEVDEIEREDSGETVEDPASPPTISLTLTQDGADSSPPFLPHMITLPLLRDCEREVMVRKAALEEGDNGPDASLLNCSHNASQLTSNDTSVLETALFSYSTPEMLKVVGSRRSPRVLLPKIKIPDFLLIEDEGDEEESGERDESKNEYEKEDILGKELLVQSPVEEELLVYEERRREEALRRQQERKRR